MSKISLTGNPSGTGVLTIAAPNTNTDRTLTLPDSTTTLVGTDATQTLTNKTIQGGALTLATAVSASGTAVDFTGIPSWVKRITVMLSGVSTNGTSNLLIRLGTSGGVETSGYASSATLTSALGANFTESTAGFVCINDNAGFSRSGRVTVANITSNTWVQDHVLGNSGVATGLVSWGGGSKTLSGTLDRVRITTVNGTDTFDAGTINIMYEG